MSETQTHHAGPVGHRHLFPSAAEAARPLEVVPHWHEAKFIEAVVEGTHFPHELTITAQNQALAAIVHAVLSRRGYTITRDMVDPLTVHARTMLPSRDIHAAP